jgi:hypothetical protein
MKPTFLEKFLKTEPPWFHLCVTDVSSITNVAFKLHMECRAQFATLRLRGNKMRSTSAFYDEFGAALQFPYYFGENANAFDECIKDLDWLNAPGYVLIIHNAEQLMIDSTNPDEQTRYFLGILESAGKHWSMPVERGAAWDRPSKPFHVVFQTDSDQAEMFRSRLKKLGLNFSELSL